MSGGIVKIIVNHRALKAVFIVNAEFLAKLLKLARSAAHAGETSFVMS